MLHNIINYKLNNPYKCQRHFVCHSLRTPCVSCAKYKKCQKIIETQYNKE